MKSIDQTHPHIEHRAQQLAALQLPITDKDFDAAYEGCSEVGAMWIAIRHDEIRRGKESSA